MRSRSWSELLPVALAAAVEGIWAGTLAAVLSGASGPALMGFAVAVVFVAALLARRVAGGKAAGKDAGGEGSGGNSSGGEGWGLQARALAAALTMWPTPPCWSCSALRWAASRWSPRPP